MTIDDGALDDQVRRADPDRWLASRFVGDPAARADLITLYAFETELTAIPARVSQPLLAEMRFAWWRDQLDGVFSGRPRRGHPVLEALAGVIDRHALVRADLDAMIDGHVDRVHGRPHDLDALFAAPMRQAVRVLAGAGHDAAANAAGRVFGLVQTGQDAGSASARVEANRALRHLPSVAFPAVAVAALPREAGDGPKRLKLTWAVARGRI